MAYQRKKKQPQIEQSHPLKTDEKLKPKTKENKQMRIFFYFYLTYQH